jgi:hypothetical protein
VVEGLKQHYTEYQRLKSEYLKSKEAKCETTPILHFVPVLIDVVEQIEIQENKPIDVLAEIEENKPTDVVEQIKIQEKKPTDVLAEIEENIDTKNIEHVYQKLSDIDKLSVNEIITLLLQEYKKETEPKKQQSLKKELISYGYTF